MIELRESPPAPTDSQLVRYLSSLADRIADTVAKFDLARLECAEPFDRVAEEASKAKHVDRIARFAGYKDSLEKANKSLSESGEDLFELYPLVLAIANGLSAGRFDATRGQQEITKIRGVLASVADEESPDDVWRRKIHQRAAEFDQILNLRDKLNLIEKVNRENERAAAAVIFSKHGLPELTPLERFRALMSRGQRDAFTRD
jgi:hypothetical protein